MSPEIIQQISAYLEAIKIPRSKSSSLREVISNEELKEEAQALQELLVNPSTFISEFTKRCQNRAKRNDRSFLSFISSPEGDCNALYWNIAKRITHIESLGDLIKLMVPEAQVLLRIEYSVNKRIPGKPTSKIKLSLTETSLETLRELPAEPKFLYYYTAGDQVLFDIREICDFDFQLHSQFFNLISQSYPKLVEPLYQHNHQFISLLKHLKQESKRQTPRECFLNLINNLRLGGETYTKKPYATPVAQTGFMLAKAYLESLPVEFRKDISDLKMHRWSKVSIKSLFFDLADGKCVETIAEQLKTILDNPLNRPLLDTYPTDSDKAKKLSFNQEQYPKSLSSERVMTTLAIPVYWQKKLFPTLRIRTIEDYLNSLFTFPPDHYSPFLRDAIINPKLPQELATLIAGEILSQKQLKAFDDAIFENLDVLNIEQVLAFAITANNPDLLKRVLETHSLSSRWQLLMKSGGRKNEIFLNRLLKISQKKERDLQIIGSVLSQEANSAIKLAHLVENLVQGLSEEKAKALRSQANELIYALGNDIYRLEFGVQRIALFLDNAHAILGYRNTSFSQRFRQIGIGILIFLAINSLVAVLACLSPVSFALAAGLSFLAPPFIGLTLASISFHALFIGLPMGILASYGFFKTDAANAKKIDQFAQAASNQWNLEESPSESLGINHAFETIPIS